MYSMLYSTRVHGTVAKRPEFNFSGPGKTVLAPYKRRIKTEEKAKVVPAVWGTG